jgi:hypothetical protein
MTPKEKRDYESIWASIAASPLAGAYITEAYWLAANVVRRAEAVFRSATTPRKPSESYIKVDHDLTTTLTTLLGQAVRLKALLTERSRNRNQTEVQHETQVRRARWLRDELLKGVKIKALLDSNIRNSLEHFDEYLDDVAIRCHEATIPRPTSVPLDVSVGRRKTFERFPIGGKRPHVENLRVYVAADKVFVNAGHEINIRALHDEARRIMKRLERLVPKDEEHPEQRGSSVFILTDSSFTSTSTQSAR